MLINRVEIRVEFGDCDPANIVYFARYFYWFDQCTNALFRAAGMPLPELFKKDGVLVPIVEARATYVTSSSYGDVFQVETHVSQWGVSSFVICHRFLRNGVLAVEGTETHVWARPHSTEPRRLEKMPVPAEVIRRLSD